MILFRQFLAISVLLVAGPALAQSGAALQADNCNVPTPDPITFVSLPGHPFGSAVTRDGCWVFVSISDAKAAPKNGIAVLRRSAGNITLDKVVPLKDVPLGLALTHDQKLLVVANSSDVTYLDVSRLISGSLSPLVGTLHDKNSPGSIEASITADDKLLFISNEWNETISVINLQKVRDANFTVDGMVGGIPVGRNPIAMVFSPDEKLLYTISEGAPHSAKWIPQCSVERQRLPARRRGFGATPNMTEGAVTVVDVDRARRQPERSVAATVPAGCIPVRAAISPGGEYLYVTNRGGDALRVFDTARLASGSSALVKEIHVGPEPVPVAVTDQGKKVLVGNSHRFGASEQEKQDITVIDTTQISFGKAAILGKVPAGGFPREFSQSADGKTLFLANFNSNSLEVIDVPKLPLLGK